MRIFEFQVPGEASEEQRGGKEVQTGKEGAGEEASGRKPNSEGQDP